MTMGVFQSMLLGPAPENYALHGIDLSGHPLSNQNSDWDAGSFGFGPDHMLSFESEWNFINPGNNQWDALSVAARGHDPHTDFASHHSRDSQEPLDMEVGPVQRSSPSPEQFFALLLRGGSTDFARHDPAILRVVKTTISRFQSLVSADSVFWQEHLLSPAGAVFSFETNEFTTLLYSVTNGFASLDGVHRGSILQMLNENEGISQHLIKLLRAGPDSVAKQVADNLLRAAIESNDSKAVTLLLGHIQCRRSIAIDLKCFRIKSPITEVENRPLALAVSLGNEELIETLLNAGASPNWPTSGSSAKQPLRMAIYDNHLDLSAKLRIMDLLIKHGAEITYTAIEAAIKRAAKEQPVFKMVMECIPDDRHRHIKLYAEHIICYVENSVATAAIRKLIDACKSTHCNKCVSKGHSMDTMLTDAIRRGNIELVYILAPYATSMSGALAGAVRSRKMELVHLLIERGARADGDPVKIFGDNEDKYNTPLSEAICLEDSDFVDILEEYGAWSRIREPHHFQIAITAAAQIGSLHWLNTIINRAEPQKLNNLHGAMRIAIKNDHPEIVLALLKAGANADGRIGPPDVLIEAFRGRNRQIVDALLETDWGYMLSGSSESMAVACEWGEMDIIDDMVNMGFPLDQGDGLRPLEVAVKSQNKDLVEYLLQFGVDPGSSLTYGDSTPLHEAVKNQDHEMMDYLLSRGAPPADIEALETAQAHDMTAFSKLCHALLEKHPSGLKGFGGELMIEAIYTDNQLQIDQLIHTKVDLNRIRFWEPSTVARMDDKVKVRKIKTDLRLKGIHKEMSPLGFAIMYSMGQNLRLISKLLDSGAQADSLAVKCDTHGYFRTPLHLAAEVGSIELMSMLLEKGADINRPARRRVLRTPLQRACELGSYDVVQFLLQKGAHVHSAPAKQYGGTALQLAAKSGSAKICELLLQLKADPHSPVPEFGGGHTAFEWAAKEGRYHILLLLWKEAPREGFTMQVLHRARNLAERHGHRGCVDIIAQRLEKFSSGRLIS